MLVLSDKKMVDFVLQILSNMLDIKCLHGDIHRTYNIHDALYNSRVIEKALDMLSNRYLR